MVLGLQLQPPVAIVEQLMDGKPRTVGRANADFGRKLRQLLPPLRRQPNFKSLTHAAMLRQLSVTATHRQANNGNLERAAPVSAGAGPGRPRADITRQK
jgi:hypothetical protein